MKYHLKRLVGYIIYAAVFAFLTITIEQLNRYYQDIFKHNFQLPHLWILFVLLGFPVLVGALLALPQFLKTARQEGAWKTDWIRLIVLGLPGLLFVLAYMACMAFPQWAVLVKVVSQILAFHQGMVKIAGILLGFVLLNSFYKQPEFNSEDERLKELPQ